MSFWDTSALLKLYIRAEPNSAFYVALGSAEGVVHIAALARFEAYSTFRRREQEGVLAAGAADLLFAELERDIEIGYVVVHQPADLEIHFRKIVDAYIGATPPIFVRTLDALHPATAIAVGETSFATADARQHAAALQAGCTVPSP